MSLLPASRPDHCQDAGLRILGQLGPRIDHGLQIRVDFIGSCANCTGFCTASVLLVTQVASKITTCGSRFDPRSGY
ncbi:MAG: hypothetical protein O3C40_18415 [Planctomycetota bacterium]|nr:hypothetical protein [Planctomycetota bacterium]